MDTLFITRQKAHQVYVGLQASGGQGGRGPCAGFRSEDERCGHDKVRYVQGGLSDQQDVAVDARGPPHVLILQVCRVAPPQHLEGCHDNES